MVLRLSDLQTNKFVGWISFSVIHQNDKKRVSLLARFFYVLKLLVPDHQTDKTNHHKST